MASKKSTICENKSLNKEKTNKNTSISFINSQTAKNGYKEEELICKYLNKKENKIFFENIFGKYQEFTRVKGNYKCDIQSEDKSIRCQVKKGKKGQKQQIDRHWISNFISNIPQLKKIEYMLKNLCELPLLPNGSYVDKSKKIKKICKSNYSEQEIEILKKTLNDNKEDILKYALLGYNKEMQPEFLIGSIYQNNKRNKVVIFKYKDIINYLKTLEFEISPRKTVIRLGDKGTISLQRKGGDSGKKSSNNLQINIIFSNLIDKVENVII